MYFLFTDETKITEPLGSDATDELEEVVDNIATFGNGLDDHSGGGEGEEGSGVNPAGAGGLPPHVKLLIWLHLRCDYICRYYYPHYPHRICYPRCVRAHVRYCLLHPSKCSKKTLANEEQEGMPFIEKESAEA